jgi:hypothetical protein
VYILSRPAFFYHAGAGAQLAALQLLPRWAACGGAHELSGLRVERCRIPDVWSLTGSCLSLIVPCSCLSRSAALFVLCVCPGYGRGLWSYPQPPLRSLHQLQHALMMCWPFRGAAFLRGAASCCAGDALLSAPACSAGVMRSYAVLAPANLASGLRVLPLVMLMTCPVLLTSLSLNYLNDGVMQCVQMP